MNNLNYHNFLIGGCDGCINFDNAANAGLQGPVAESSELYDTNMPFMGKTMSRADFFNLMGITGVEHSIDHNNEHCPTPPDCYTPLVTLKTNMKVIGSHLLMPLCLD